MVINLVRTAQLLGELNKHGQRFVTLLTNQCLQHPIWSAKAFRTFEEVIDKNLINPHTLPHSCLQIVAQQPVNVPLVVLPTKEEKKRVTFSADGGAELHHPLGLRSLHHIHPGHAHDVAVDI